MYTNASHSVRVPISLGTRPRAAAKAQGQGPSVSTAVVLKTHILNTLLSRYWFADSCTVVELVHLHVGVQRATCARASCASWALVAQPYRGICRCQTSASPALGLSCSRLLRRRQPTLMRCARCMLVAPRPTPSRPDSRAVNVRTLHECSVQDLTVDRGPFGAALVLHTVSHTPGARSRHLQCYAQEWCSTQSVPLVGNIL